MNYYFGAFKKYVDFSGRARRKEYWMFTLFNMIITIVLYVLSMMSISDGKGPGIWFVLLMIYSLAVLLPSLAIAVRRLHDTDRSGWWLLIGFVPLIGGIILLIFMLLDSSPGSNTFGANPKAA